MSLENTDGKNKSGVHGAGLVLLFILGSNLGGVGPVRGLRGEEEELV